MTPTAALIAARAAVSPSETELRETTFRLAVLRAENRMRKEKRNAPNIQDAREIVRDIYDL